MIELPKPPASVALSEEAIQPMTFSLMPEVSSISISGELLEKEQRSWNKIIDDYLLEWGRDPSSIEDEGILAPSGKVITAACSLSRDLADNGFPSPTRVTPDGEGGVIFEWIGGDHCFRLELAVDGSLDSVEIDSQDRVVRQKLV